MIYMLGFLLFYLLERDGFLPSFFPKNFLVLSSSWTIKVCRFFCFSFYVQVTFMAIRFDHCFRKNGDFAKKTR